MKLDLCTDKCWNISTDRPISIHHLFEDLKEAYTLAKEIKNI